MIQERLKQDTIKFMKEKDEALKSVISIIKSNIAAVEKECKLKGKEFKEEDIISVFSKELKQSKESLEGAISSGRKELVEKVQKQIEWLESYLPKQLNKEEIEIEIKKVIEELGIEKPSKKDIGRIMKVVSPMLKGAADGKLINEVLTNLIS